MEIKHKRTGEVLLVVNGSTLRGADLRGALLLLFLPAAYALNNLVGAI